MDVVDQYLRAENQDDTDADQHDLGGEVGDGEDEVELGRLLRATDVEHGEGDDHHSPGDYVSRTTPQRLPKHGQVVGNEVGRDRYRDHVVEHLAPSGDETDQLVEGVPGEAGGAARLGVHHRCLGVGGCGGGEDQPRDHERDRGQAESKRGGDTEGVVDRGRDLAGGGGKER